MKPLNACQVERLEEAEQVVLRLKYIIENSQLEGLD
jgi:hypothetical protein